MHLTNSLIIFGCIMLLCSVCYVVVSEQTTLPNSSVTYNLDRKEDQIGKEPLKKFTQFLNEIELLSSMHNNANLSIPELAFTDKHVLLQLFMEFFQELNKDDWERILKTCKEGSICDTQYKEHFSINSENLAKNIMSLGFMQQPGNPFNNTAQGILNIIQEIITCFSVDSKQYKILTSIQDKLFIWNASIIEKISSEGLIM